MHEEPDSPVLAERLAKARTDESLAQALAPEILSGLAALYGRDATVGPTTSHAVALDVSRVFARFYDHAAPFDAEGDFSGEGLVAGIECCRRAADR